MNHLSVDADAATTQLTEILTTIRSIAAHLTPPPPIPATSAGEAFADYGEAINDLVHHAHHRHMTTLRHSEATVLAALDTITTITTTDEDNAHTLQKGTRR